MVCSMYSLINLMSPIGSTLLEIIFQGCSLRAIEKTFDEKSLLSGVDLWDPMKWSQGFNET